MSLLNVCVDELLVIGFVPAGDSCAPGRDTLLTARADAVYEAWDIERSAARAVDHALHFEGWGVDVKGDAGFAGVRFSKRCVQAELGLYGCVYGCRSLYWRRLLGLWNFSFALHPPLLSIFGRLLPKGQLLDELIGWSLANLIAEADLRAGISYVVGCIDASSCIAGGVVATVIDEEKKCLFALTEQKATHVRLDWVEESDMPGVDTRGLAAHIIVPQRWCVNVCYHFRVESHINLLEADELWSCGCAE
jgi:hypothetical protein